MARTGDGERSESFTVVISCCYEAMFSENDQQTRSDYRLRPLVGNAVIFASTDVDGRTNSYVIVSLFGMGSQGLEERWKVVHAVHFHVPHHFFADWCPESLSKCLGQCCYAGSLIFLVSAISVDSSQVLAEVIDRGDDGSHCVWYFGSNQ